MAVSKFSKYDVADLLGFSRIAEVTDAEVWSCLLTPQVKALIGPITEFGQPQVMETEKGHFPGDEVTNLNKHLLYGGKGGYVRFPYISTFHRTAYGALVIKRDALKIKVFGWVGDVVKGSAELIFISALRDRRFDGSKRANDTALLYYPYDDPVFHKRLSENLRSVEVSIYSFLPGSRVVAATGEPEFDEFIEKPFTFLDRPELFAHYFARVWKSKRAPGQWAAPIGDVSKLALAGFERVASRRGYDLLEAAVSHYHVARWFGSGGYRYSFEEGEREVTRFAASIKRLKEGGISLTRSQESWLCVLQSLRPVELIAQGLFLDGPIWPQDNVGPRLLWMNKPLTQKAFELIGNPLPDPVVQPRLV